MKDQLNLRVYTKNRSIQRRKMAKWSLFKCHLKQRVCMDWVDKPQNYKDLYGILQLLRSSHLNNFQLKTLKLGWVALHSVTFQLKCLDFQSNRYKKLVPALSRFCNGLQSTCLSVDSFSCTRNVIQLLSLLHILCLRVEFSDQVTSY